jgi:hypothetical protein
MRYLLAFIILVTFNQVIRCQTESSLLADISNKFQAYCDSYPREEIFVETDRNIYISGENVWFSVWLVSRQKEAAPDLSKIAYVEILGPAGRPVLQKRIGLDNGTGSGRFSLSDTLSPGVYIIRAYTNWMKNFMPDNCFTRKLRVYGASDDQNLRFSEPVQKAVPEQRSLNNNLKIGISREKNGIVQVNVMSDEQYRNLHKGPGLLFIQTCGKINYNKILTLSGDSTTIEFLSDSLLPGINQITFFDSGGRPVSESFIYTPYRKADTFNVDIMMPDSGRSRELQSVRINAAENGSATDTTYLSISIVPSGSELRAGLSDYLVFGSEFGTLPDIFQNEKLVNIPDSIVTNFLSGRKSNWINWDLILAGKMPQIKYARENRYHHLTGRTFTGLSDDSPVDHQFFLSVPGRYAVLQYSGTGKDSDFEFCLPADNRIRDLIIQTDVPLVNNKILLTSNFSDSFQETEMRNSTDTIRSSLVRKLAMNQRIMKIYKYFEIPLPPAKEKFTSGARCFYVKPDFELRMADYIALPTMQEVFFELIPGVAVTSKNKVQKITIRDPYDGELFENPLLMIDGVMVRDPGVILGLDPLIIEKIEVVRSRYILGDYTFPGIVNIITLRGDVGNITLPEDVSRIRYRAFEVQEKFKYPDYSLTETRNSHIPDFRNTLYWNTLTVNNLARGINLTFPASDFLSDYDVIVQGTTTNGRFISGRRKIRIIK